MKNAVRFPHVLKSQLLVDLPEDQKTDFVNQCAVRFYDKPQQILVQDQRPSGMFIVAHGMVEIGYFTPGGQCSILHHAGPGEVLGIIEAVADAPCAATCLTQPSTTLLFCPTPLLFDYIKSPVFIRNFARNFCDLLDRDNKFRSVDQFQSVDQKICSYLARLANQTQVIRRSQSYLANMVGCSRQTMNRMLGALRNDGIIELRKGAIVVLKQSELQARADTHPDVDKTRLN
ncbi:Crp/Fnr family transcriptional regulator [Aestuariivita sp.]|jgi:CRP-like cAMP-binding protein|uniref:Crp/Fnr family transcriptional regulator n=1 Tax=Aestuariivita sp. TaxID=1872407 RepID=UPI0021736F00|nr:Crp/Fnr family transcriptional regulator [Aestuariivita sp.]MCE8006848.1 Crp/Fnr family transcriptional regulator [Aestuariivita sp.]